MCADAVFRFPSPFFSSVSHGPCREVGNRLGWTPLQKTAGSGVWGLRGALVGTSIFLACNWVRKGPFLTVQRCASWWTRSWGGGRRGHCLCYPWGVCWAAQNTACQIGEKSCGFICIKLYMLASAGQPSLHSYYACMFFWLKGHPREIAGKSMVRPLFLLTRFFCLVEILWFGSGA